MGHTATSMDWATGMPIDPSDSSSRVSLTEGREKLLGLKSAEIRADPWQKTLPYPRRL